MAEVQANAQVDNIRAATGQAAAQLTGERQRGLENVAGVGAPSPQEVGAVEGQDTAIGGL